MNNYELTAKAKELTAFLENFTGELNALATKTKEQKEYITDFNLAVNEFKNVVKEFFYEVDISNKKADSNDNLALKFYQTYLHDIFDLLLLKHRNLLIRETAQTATSLLDAGQKIQIIIPHTKVPIEITKSDCIKAFKTLIEESEHHYDYLIGEIWGMETAMFYIKLLNAQN
jgi:hypothetical protein